MTHWVDFNHESASCTVAVDGNAGTVLRVYSKTRGEGHATGLLTKVIEYADKNGLRLNLRARQYGGPIQTMLSNEDLVKFYEKFGFEVAPYDDKRSGTIMTRPRTKNTPYDEREN